MEVTKSTNEEEGIPQEPSLPERQRSTVLQCIIESQSPDNVDVLATMIRNFKIGKDAECDKLIGASQERLTTLTSKANLALDLYEKAVDDIGFTAAYGRMVKYIIDHQSLETARKFRKQILDTCQKEFQKGSPEEEEISKLENDLAEAEDDKKEALKARLEKRFMTQRRALGNVCFIGELYKLEMLTPKIMVDCISMLLGTHNEENYECLCKLLTTIGQKLEGQLVEAEERVTKWREKGVVPKFAPEPKFMDETFAKIINLRDDEKIHARIRFALLNIYELRQNEWKPLRESTDPIDEVHRREEMKPVNTLGPTPKPKEIGHPGQPENSEWKSTPVKPRRKRAKKKKSTGLADTSCTGLVVLETQGASFLTNELKTLNNQ